jgi:hypothetical protein
MTAGTWFSLEFGAKFQQERGSCAGQETDGDVGARVCDLGVRVRAHGGQHGGSCGGQPRRRHAKRPDHDSEIMINRSIMIRGS